MRIAAKALLAALFVLNVYRAATQSLVHDEAFTWQAYLSGPVSEIFTRWDANLHFLSTLLMRVSTRLFGFSELALRLPSVLADAWYFVSVYRLAQERRLLLGVALAALNPLVLDFLVAARGYGLALACLMYGLLCCERSRFVRASAAFGFGVMANLTIAVPVAVIAAIYWKHWRQLVPPMAAILILFVAISPVRHARQSSFYYGAATLRKAFRCWRRNRSPTTTDSAG
jgi:hypothetical protein